MNENVKCCDSCGCDRERFSKASIAIGVLLYAIGVVIALFADFNLSIFGEAADTIAPYLEFAIFIASYILIGGDIVKKAFSNIADLKNLFDENFLMSVASLGAFAIGEYPEGVAVMALYKIGEFLQDKAVSNSKKSISYLLDIKPQYANLKIGDKIVKTDPQNVKKGDIIVVKAGEKIPLDSVVISGRSFLDISVLSGESVPKEVKEGDRILSGAINKSGLLSAEVISEFAQSTVSKIVKFVEEAGAKKANTEHFIRKFAKVYTPIVVAGAVLIAILPPLIFSDAVFSEWFYKALVLLVISCPCALVISVPLSFFAGLGGASKRGILVKGGNYLEALSLTDTVVFDKTGTLTKGKFAVSKALPSADFSKEELLYYAACAESASPHPIAASILSAYSKEINPSDISLCEELFGFGVRAVIRGKTILVGNEKLMRTNQIDFEPTESINTIAYVSINGVYAGHIVISDEIKPESLTIAQELRRLGVNNIVILTGDRKDIADDIAKKLAIDEVFSELLPLEKSDKIEMLSQKMQKGKKLAFVGDGINDAPSLARADVGIAMGALGSDITAQAADIVLMNDNPASVATAIKIAKKTTGIASQNIAFALGVKALILTLGAVGLSGMWGAIFADVGVSILAVFNSVRAFRV